MKPDQGRRTYQALGAAWLIVVGVLTWRHAAESVWPPIYDAYTYFAKAKYVWDAIDAHRIGLHDLLDVEPSFRPFATVLMSYPFGFAPDFRAFYFRSTFWPVALVCVAGFVAAWTPFPSRRYLRMSALSACFLSTLSLFFYFELYPGGPPPVSYWGLVDSFLTGLAGFAMAAATRSVRQRSIGWACVSVLASVVAIFVKPSGLPVAALCGAFLGAGWAWRALEDWRKPNGRVGVWQALLVFAVEGIFLGGSAWVALNSAYLSAKNLAYGRAAIDVMRAELQIDWLTQLDIAMAGLGPFVIMWVVVTTIVFAVVRVRQYRNGEAIASIDGLLMCFGLVALVGGFWFWIYGSGGRTQVRYFAPFLYVAIFCALPSLLTALEHAGPWARRAVGLLMVGTMVNLVLLLAWPNPNLAWQVRSGVNVKSGTRPPSILQAKELIASSNGSAGSTVFVYSCVDGIPDAMFESVFDMDSLELPAPRFVIRRPVDWQRPTVIRVEEILSSDYVLVDPSRARPEPAPDDFSADADKAKFNRWLDGLARDDGVETVSRQPESLLLRIVDRTRFRRAMDAFIAANRWRPLFVAENTPKWWSAEGVRSQVDPGDVSRADIDFGGLVYVQQMLVKPADAGTIELAAWIRVSPDMSGDDWAMAVHVIGDNGQMLANHDVALGHREAAPDGHPFMALHVKFARPTDARRIAVGFYRGGGQMLKAKVDDTDWDGARLLLDLPRVAK